EGVEVGTSTSHQTADDSLVCRQQAIQTCRFDQDITVDKEQMAGSHVRSELQCHISPHADSPEPGRVLVGHHVMMPGRAAVPVISIQRQVAAGDDSLLLSIIALWIFCLDIAIDSMKPFYFSKGSQTGQKRIFLPVTA